MGLDDYRADLDERIRVRALYNSLATQCDACVTLAAPAAAPVGLGSTGDPVFAVPFSLLGVPAISLPLLHEQGSAARISGDRIRREGCRTCAVAACVETVEGPRRPRLTCSSLTKMAACILHGDFVTRIYTFNG